MESQLNPPGGGGGGGGGAEADTKLLKPKVVEVLWEGSQMRKWTEFWDAFKASVDTNLWKARKWTEFGTLSKH